ncbi:NifB/NifX family molybdenum-iron cluster-binding protein [Desulfopila sp. IMCC35008]|uniref:NifB/NifX family molybdenum-iron cluster-binding protein n=1 Tax=Desulfopila sp. IMCC35008 TaxID=2653858 RepID=UPI0013D61248|nr:NifB/NifX family molybdenum-iron cluster-binding protein [Desulfopila sp. IMCC35008]
METSSNTTQTSCIGPDHHPGMIRLPIAPRVNHRIRFAPLTEKKEQHIFPAEAVRKVEELVTHGSTTDTVLLYGPGDPLADIDSTLETVQLLQARFPELGIIVRTLGVNGLKHTDKLQKAGIKEIELILNGVDTSIQEKIYAWVRPGFKTLQLAEGVAVLHSEQMKAIQAFKDAGLRVRLITTLYPTVNDDHLVILAKRAAELGADEIVLNPYSPEEGADIVLPAPENEQLDKLVASMNTILPTTKGRPIAIGPLASGGINTMPKPSSARPNVAVVSTNGMDIDLHLGQAPQILVYGPREDGLACLLECRPAPEPGTGSERWDLLASRIQDCFALLTASAGERPKKILSDHNIQVIISNDNIEGTVDALYGGGKKGKGCGKQKQPSV